jgi:hypothetical protein
MQRPWAIWSLAGSLVGASPTVGQSVLYNNGTARGGVAPSGLSTGALTSLNVAAPTGFLWSERPVGNLALGFSADETVGSRLADDFTITDPGGWLITGIDTFGYVTDAPITGPSPFPRLTMQIWRGRPGDAGSTVVFGDPISNRLAASVQIMVLRGNASGNAGGLVRSIWANTAAVNTTLPPGTYWIDFSEDRGFNPPVTIAGVRGAAPANARQFLTPDVGPGAWQDLIDPGTGDPYLPVAQELPFIVRGQVVGNLGCYANCDGSTAVPFLNVNDFICFQTRFAAGESYANCDGSTIPPLLNVNDFICFQTQFAAGCSAP